MIQQNASASEEISATSKELASQAEQLQTTMMFFNVMESKENMTISRRRSEKRSSQLSHSGTLEKIPEYLSEISESSVNEFDDEFEKF